MPATLDTTLPVPATVTVRSAAAPASFLSAPEPQPASKRATSIESQIIDLPNRIVSPVVGGALAPPHRAKRRL